MKKLKIYKAEETSIEEVSFYTDLVPILESNDLGEAYIELEADDLEELMGYIASTANHTEEEGHEEHLSQVLERAETLLKETPPKPYLN